jgi:hypothetical protein
MEINLVQLLRGIFGFVDARHARRMEHPLKWNRLKSEEWVLLAEEPLMPSITKSKRPKIQVKRIEPQLFIFPSFRPRHAEASSTFHQTAFPPITIFTFYPPIPAQ